MQLDLHVCVCVCTNSTVSPPRLSVCEKALAEYLETKRLTFPRFYFVSATDLLEIVSKGTQPKQVNITHLLFNLNIQYTA